MVKLYIVKQFSEKDLLKKAQKSVASVLSDIPFVVPGKPDLIFPKYKTVIFIHGCFWHGHEGCKYITSMLSY